MSYHNRSRFMFIAPFVIVAVAIVGLIVWAFVYLGSQSSATCTVDFKERTTHVRDGGTSQQKLVYTEECGVFEVQDNWFLGQFNSADTYGSLEEGQTYDFKTVGFRNGLFSMFPNILEATPAS